MKLRRTLLFALLLALSCSCLVALAQQTGEPPAGTAAEAGSADGASQPTTASGEAGTAEGGAAASEEADSGDDECSKSNETYNLGLHIGSVFILLGVSLLGSFTPVVLHISSARSVIHTIIRLGTFFGFGTILATAFIHMMVPAVEKLSSPCLPESWTESYEAWAYLFVVIAILGMQLLDYLVEMAFSHYSKGGANLHGAIVQAHGARHTGAQMLSTDASEAAETGSQRSDEESGNAAEVCPQHGEGCKTLLQPKTDPSQIVGIYLMEAGIVFHSMLIGLALGVAGGSSFTTLLIALSFHQFFEGFAIGSAAVDSGLSVTKSSLMALIYSLTTPIGIAIGIGVHESFNHNSTTALYVEGILDSLSTGILIYVVLVELINPMMTQSKWLRAQRWWLQLLSFAALYCGAGVMAVIGKWA